jgi:hypothetical protein
MNNLAIIQIIINNDFVTNKLKGLTMTSINLIDIIQSNKLTPDGEPKTATQVCESLGLKDPSKSTLNLVAKTLRHYGVKQKRTSSGRFFYCKDWQSLFDEEKKKKKANEGSA